MAVRNQLERDQQTICAISSPPGVGGVSVLRVSGAKSVDYVGKLASFLPAAPRSHHAYVGILKSAKSEAIDQVVVLPYLGERSYTGETTVEIFCHGSPAIANWILEELVGVGCKTAEKGEFTYRAFSHGKIDLVQAESVLELIESESKLAAKQALNQLRGGLSQKLNHIEHQIIWAMAHIEAGIDFSAEDIQVVSTEQMQKHLSDLLAQIRILIGSFKSSQLVQEGFYVVLSGKPNVGKSSLLNLLAEEDKAIVSEFAGTTRDLVETKIFMNGLPIRFVDTAGLRESTDHIEKMGIQRSRQAQAKADLNIYVFDLREGLDAEDLQAIKSLSEGPLLVVGNKSDLVNNKSNNINELSKSFPAHSLALSAHNLADRERLLQLIGKNCTEIDSLGDGVLTRTRQLENLQSAEAALDEALLATEQQVGFEFIAVHLQQAILAIQLTLGKRFDDDIMDRVFREFCIGK